MISAKIKQETIFFLVLFGIVSIPGYVSSKIIGETDITSPFVIKSDGVYKMWFTLVSKSGEADTYSEAAGIYYVESADGINWSYDRRVLALPASREGWDSSYVGASSVMVRDKKYLMWYRSNMYGLQQIGLAVSEDGISWKKYKDNPVFRVNKDSWDDKSLVAPHVIDDHGALKMYYRGSKRRDQDYSGIGLAVSRDGVNWKRQGNGQILTCGLPGEWDDRQVGDPAVLYNEALNLYQMWYSGASYADSAPCSKKLNTTNPGCGKMIGYATSKDGIVWEKYKGNPVIRLGAAGAWDSVKADNPFVMFENGIYKMWYRGCDGKSNGIGYATSKDGINWKKYKGNPVLSP